MSDETERPGALEEAGEPVAEMLDETDVDRSASAIEMTDAEVTDELPEDLDVTGLVGPYTFPNNNRRRVPALLYTVMAIVLVVVWATAEDSPLVNDGYLGAAIGLALFSLYCFVAGVTLRIDESEALVAATRAVGFPVGHASAQMAWRGLLSRPTWRILLYSAENPPTRRGFALVDGVSGEVLEHFVEDNPEEWSE